MRLVLLSLITFCFTGAAQASLCKLQAEVDGSSWHLAVGGVEMGGMGTIQCLRNNKWTTVKTVMVEAGGVGFGLGFKKFENAKLFSTGLGFVESPEALLGQFVFVKAGAQLGPIGGDAGVTLYFNAKKGKRGIAIPFGLTFNRGSGIDLGLDVIEVNVVEVNDDQY